jgi:hypothetical protein
LHHAVLTGTTGFTGHGIIINEFHPGIAHN